MSSDSPTSIETSDRNAKAELTRKFTEKCIDLLSKKCDSAKEDLDKNWVYQITTLGIGLGLIFGLSEAFSKKLLEEQGHARALYLVIPLVNLYLFVRFGLLATHFSRIRNAFEAIVKNYCEREGITFNGEMKDIVSTTYETNSNFEHYHLKAVPFPVNLYFLFAPIILGSGQGVSVYLLQLFAKGNVTYQIVITVSYIIVCLALYYAYYEGNKKLYLSVGSTYRILLIPLAIVFGIIAFLLIWVIGSTVTV